MSDSAARLLASTDLSCAGIDPSVAQHLLDAGGVSAGGVAVLRTDPLVALRVLNASSLLELCADERPAARIAHCVELAGPHLLQAALLSQPAHGPLAALSGFRAHSLLTAEIARELAQLRLDIDPEDAALAGLLLDVAVPVFGADAAYARLVAGSHDEEVLAAQELGEFGVSHGSLSAALLRAPLPQWFSQALMFHHEAPALFGEAAPVLRLIRAAEMLAGVIGPAGPVVLDGVHRLLGLSAEATVSLLERSRQRLAELAVAPVQVRPDGYPLLFSAQSIPPAASVACDPRLLALARRSLLLQALSGPDAGEAWQRTQLAGALMFDLDAPVLLSSDLSGGLRVMDEGWVDGTSAASPIDLGEGAARDLALRLAAGEPCLLAPGPEMSALPVTLRQVFMRGAEPLGGLLLPVPGVRGNASALAYTLTAQQFGRLDVRRGELASFAASIAEAGRAREARQMALGSLRDGLVERFRSHAARNRAEMLAPLGLAAQQIKAMRLKLGADSELDSEVQVMDEQLRRVASVLQQFDVLPSEQESGAHVDVNELLEDVMSELEVSVLRPRAIVTEMHLDPALPPLQLSSVALREALQALLRHVAESISGGRLMVSSADSLNVNGRLQVELRIRDFGRGLDSGRVAHLFDADTAARPLQRALKLLQAQGGSLACKSSLGQGTVYQILLPRLTRR